MSEDLKDRLRSSAKAFREHPIYDSEGDGCYLIVQADELSEAAHRIERLEEVLEAGAVCMSPTERVRWIDRARSALNARAVLKDSEGCGE